MSTVKTKSVNSVGILRKRILDAGKKKHVYRNNGFIEVAIPDMEKAGCLRVGRIYILNAGGIGVHEVAEANYRDKKGNPIDDKQRKKNYTNSKGHIGCNCNSSALSKAQMSILLQSFGIRHILSSGGEELVNTWHDYEKDSHVLTENDCHYLLS